MDLILDQSTSSLDLTTSSDPVSQLNQRYLLTVKKAQNPSTNKPLVQNKMYEVSNESLRKLRPGKWLNDELINAQVCLVN